MYDIMNVPIELSFDISMPKEPYKNLVLERAAKLDKICDYLSSCRVAIEERQKHMESGNPFRVRIKLTVPAGHELVARSEPGEGNMHDDLSVVINRTFDAVERRLKKLMEKQRGEVKRHPAQETVGIVTKVFTERGYGFLKNDMDEEIYFHENSVLNGEFDRIHEGTVVRFVARMGEEGLQASTIQVMGKPGSRHP